MNREYIPVKNDFYDYPNNQNSNIYRSTIEIETNVLNQKDEELLTKNLKNKNCSQENYKSKNSFKKNQEIQLNYEHNKKENFTLLNQYSFEKKNYNIENNILEKISNEDPEQKENIDNIAYYIKKQNNYTNTENFFDLFQYDKLKAETNSLKADNFIFKEEINKLHQININLEKSMDQIRKNKYIK